MTSVGRMIELYMQNVAAEGIFFLYLMVIFF